MALPFVMLSQFFRDKVLRLFREQGFINGFSFVFQKDYKEVNTHEYVFFKTYESRRPLI